MKLYRRYMNFFKEDYRLFNNGTRINAVNHELNKFIYENIGDFTSKSRRHVLADIEASENSSFIKPFTFKKRKNK